MNLDFRNKDLSNSEFTDFELSILEFENGKITRRRTNTEFNSFRQNVPLMPLMGLTIYTALQQRYPALASRLRVNSHEMSG